MNHTEKSALRVVIADAQEITGNALAVLTQNHPRLVLNYRCQTGAELQDYLIRQGNETDLVFWAADVTDPLTSEITRLIAERFDHLKTVYISDTKSVKILVDLLSLRPQAILLKENGLNELLFLPDVFHYVGRYYSPEVTETFAGEIIRFADVARTPEPEYAGFFSKRETEILEAFASGLNNTEIAEKLSISVHTVDTHRRNMFKKSGVKTSASLIAFAKDRRLI